MNSMMVEFDIDVLIKYFELKDLLIIFIYFIVI